ncbi:DsbC family protein [Marinobacter sp. CHS3-4]|uniref:DsbC family protein n=1 Tax=Marinobacter sp. CHS3-4 TaxID=3045174 RepID=UPI0024B5AB6A|nr:DsbC family protein [Marinobacter sp. CHS3-4]MDI9246140.1 DsbC family protein [Marinobacter sp. CHS3-4]
MSSNRMTPALVSLIAGIACAIASGVAIAESTEEAIRAKLTEAIPRLDITGVKASEVPGLYEVSSTNGGNILATEDGQYLLTGDVLKVTSEGIANLSEEKRLGERAQALAAYDQSKLITFPANGEQKASIDVFTDIDCPYCRKFHDEVSALNDMGIAVNYYGFPRSGPNTPSFSKYISVWCADDQQAAMDAAKQGKSVPNQSCENPVEAQYRLGQQVGVTGTPAIILDNGQMVPGYRPANQIAQALGLR